MLRKLFIFAFLLTSCLSVKDSIFKDCSSVAFCSAFRSRTPTEIYTVDSSTVFTPALNQFELTLVGSGGYSNASLTITTLQDNTFRLQIKEVDSSPYQLKDVLDGEPKIGDIPEIDSEPDYAVIASGDNRVAISFSPFSIQFFKNDNLQVVLDGSYLSFDHQGFSLGISFPQARQLYGLHEHADRLALQTTQPGGTDPYRLRNLDVPGYELNSPMALYGAVPVLYAHGSNGTSGVFLHNAAEQWIEITNGDSTEAYFMVESGALDLFVLMGPTPTEVVRQYVTLTGTAHLPQLWALGYHQSRWNYMTQEEVKDVVANFTTYNFPLDVIWLDIEYSDGKKYFTWNPSTFSDPVEMQQNISATHKRLITIIDPHIKVEEGYSVYDGALEKDLFVKNADGTNFQGDCWPGLSSYMDFLNPAARDYYASFYSYENFPSTTSVLSGIWNDMNEPSVFDDSLEKTLPWDALHYGEVSHHEMHNIYGFLHTMSTHQGLMSRDNGTTRPFVLTRSHFAGTQRYSAIWTGDNVAEWGYLSISYAQCLNANLLGIVFCGADVGGFSNNPSEELFQRWYQAGAWLPFYRAHSDINAQRREPYLFNEDVQAVVRDAIQVRYQHLPVWYTLFYEHTRNRDPIIRPLFYQYPEDENVYAIDDELLLGRDILVRPVMEPGVESVQVYFPGGENESWMPVDGISIFPGQGFVDVPVDIKKIPVYYRTGSVIVRKDNVRLSSDEMATDGHSIYVQEDENHRATGTVYLDDNTSFNYVNKKYNYLRIDALGTSVAITKIDDDMDADGFDFVIQEIVINSFVKKPHNGQPGRYETKVYKTTANGQLLSNLKLNFNKTVTFQL